MRDLKFALVSAVLIGAWSVAAQPFWQPMNQEVSWNYSAETSFTAESGFERGATDLGDFSATLVRANASAVLSPTEHFSWGIGPSLEYGHFEGPSGSPIPENVYGIALRFSSQWRFADRWTLRSEIRPGLYSDMEDISWDDFNAPILLALGYEVNTNLLIALGLNINFRSDLATIGGPGMRWRFAEDWTLNLFLPKPTLDYRINRQWAVYGGGEWRGGAYRLSEEFGDRHGDPELNDEDFTYRELRVLTGLRYQVNRTLRLALEGGYAFGREVEFRQVDEELDGDAAPFVQLVVGGSF